MTNIIQTARDHRCITTGILGTFALGGTALIGVGVISFLMVAGKFPPVHLTGIKMKLPISLVGSAAVGVGVTVELAVLGVTVVFLLKKSGTASNKLLIDDEPARLVNLTEDWLTLDDPRCQDNAKITTEMLQGISDISGLLRDGELAKLEKRTHTEDDILFYKHGDTIRFKYIESTSEPDDNTRAALLAHDVNEQGVELGDVFEKATTLLHTISDDQLKILLKKPEPIPFSDSRGKQWEIRVVGAGQTPPPGITLLSIGLGATRIMIVRQEETVT